VILKWDGELGAVIEAQFPKNLTITPSFANQIFSMHFSGDLSIASDLISFQISDKKVISKLLNCGSVKRSVALLLHKFESFQSKERNLLEISKKIKSNFKNAIKNLESLYKEQFSLKK